MPVEEIFHRQQYAQEIVQDLLKPTVLKEQLRSGVFLSGIRRVGKTTFVRQDLIPALRGAGALPIYVDLWADKSKDPSTLVHEAVRNALQAVENPASGILAQLKRLKGLDVGAAGFKFGFQLDSLGATDGVTLAQAFAEVVRKLQVDVVLIVDEVQQAMLSDSGINLMHALKAARDRINADPDMPGHFLFVGTGSHKSLVSDMAIRRTQPFAGAVAVDFRVLDRDFVEWQLERVASHDARVVVPNLDAAVQGFRAMGNRPEEFTKALLQLQRVQIVDNDVAGAFKIICQTLADAAGDVELAAIENFGELGKAIFDRIARGRTTGLFGAEALAAYSELTGQPVVARDVQLTADKMIEANLIMRQGHGIYAVSDPFIQKIWTERIQATQQLLGGDGTRGGEPPLPDPARS
ncbi:ATP-binding protein [Ramlibacter sp.]|uniref:ATP-binding protein n=1 Tax=Ramlibacter sp. TaxID=1917967 RepID=UPI003D0C1E64